MKNKDFLICQCNSVEHQFSFFYDDNDKIVYINTHLSKFGFWKRLIVGIKYIFGYQSIYGTFDEFIIKSEDVNKFEKVVEFLKK